MLIKRCGCDKDCSHPWHFVFEINGERFRKSTRTRDRRKAQRAEDKARGAAVDEKEGTAPPKITRLSSHIDAYVKFTLNENKTAYKDRAVLERLMDIVGDQSLTKIDSFGIERWKSARVDEVEKSTVNRELNIIRGCFTKAVAWKLLTISPATAVQSYKVDGQRIRVLDPDELRAVLAIPDPFVVSLCRATLESLARISELLSLQRSHIGPSWIEFRRKGGQVDRVLVTDGLRTSLLARCHANGWVFGEGEGGTVPTQQTATNRVSRALQAAGVPDASHHTMRHTGVTIMLEHGINPRTIQRLAGWSSLRMLERYGHSRDAEMARAVSSVASYLEANVARTPPTTKTTTQDFAIAVS